MRETPSELRVDMALAASNVSSEARRDVKWERTTSRLSERERASRLDEREARERRLLISVWAAEAVSVSALAVEYKGKVTRSKGPRVIFPGGGKANAFAIMRMPDPLRLEIMAAAAENNMMW